MKRKYIGASLLLAAAAVTVSFISAAPAAEDLDPLKVAGDTHKLVFENQFVRVIDAQVPPGKLEAKHNHPHGFTVHLADYTVETKSFPEGKVTKHERKFGSVVWSEAIVHEVRNVGKTPSHAIRVELKY